MSLSFYYPFPSSWVRMLFPFWKCIHRLIHSLNRFDRFVWISNRCDYRRQPFLMTLLASKSKSDHFKNKHQFRHFFQTLVLSICSVTHSQQNVNQNNVMCVRFDQFKIAYDVQSPNLDPNIYWIHISSRTNQSIETRQFFRNKQMFFFVSVEHHLTISGPIIWYHFGGLEFLWWPQHHLKVSSFFEILFHWMNRLVPRFVVNGNQTNRNWSNHL